MWKTRILTNLPTILFLVAAALAILSPLGNRIDL